MDKIDLRSFNTKKHYEGLFAWFLFNMKSVFVAVCGLTVMIVINSFGKSTILFNILMMFIMTSIIISYGIDLNNKLKEK